MLAPQRFRFPFPQGWRRAALLPLLVLTVCLAACGGGGSSSSSSSGGGSNSGGGSSNGIDTSTLPPLPSEQPITPSASNTVPVTVNSGVAGVQNIPTVSVQICVHGSTTNCTTVNNVQVDTASYGVRIVSSALGSLLNTLPINSATTGGELAECTAFADGYTWGTVRSADVKIGGETASNIPIQVIGDLGTSNVPSGCAGNGAQQSTASDLGANGILGIGVAPNDCGSACQTSSTSFYYACPSGSNCNAAAVTTIQQVANPVQNLPVDNNGVILQMQPVSYSGAASATGTLVFGIGTESNNALNASQRFQTDPSGDIIGTFNGRTLNTFLDSGSNALFFNDSSLPQCGGALGTFYCPSTSLTFTAGLAGYDNSSGSTSFGVVSASTLLGSNGNNGNYALNDLAGLFGSLPDLDLGLPFFYGRYVYVGADRTQSGGTQQPYVAF
jgi:hypothetical protein